MSHPHPVVCLLTDFGLTDNYVAGMKAVLVSVQPAVQIIDITHQIPAQNIRFGAYQLMTSYRYFPKGTLVIAVVDPGVGSKRKIIYAEAGGYRFIGPDNGLLSWVFKDEKPEMLVDLSALADVPKVSATFHGRDVMAQVAARLLAGEDVLKLGKPHSSWVKLSFPRVEKSGSKWRGEILAVDGFGNLITNISAADVAPLAAVSNVWIDIGKKPVTVRGLNKAYADVEIGKPVVLTGSAGFLEISVRDGNAAHQLKVSAADPVAINFRT